MARKYNPHEVHPITYLFVGILLLLTLVGISPMFNNSSQTPQVIKSKAQDYIHITPAIVYYRPWLSGGQRVGYPGKTCIETCNRYITSSRSSTCESTGTDNNATNGDLYNLVNSDGTCGVMESDHVCRSSAVNTGETCTLNGRTINLQTYRCRCKTIDYRN